MPVIKSLTHEQKKTFNILFYITIIILLMYLLFIIYLFAYKQRVMSLYEITTLYSLLMLLFLITIIFKLLAGKKRN
jgi:hypothetical protein